MPFSLLDARNKFGGSAPDSLNEYYRGGGVPDTVGCANVPTSGTISLQQLEAAVLDSSSATILTHVWNNRTTYFRGSTGSNVWSWQGDTFDNANMTINRFVGSYTISSSISQASPNHSNWTTMVFFSAGSSASISSVTVNGSGYSPVQNETGLEMSWWIVHVPLVPTLVTSASVTSTRSAGNSGTWDKLLALPGRWYIDTGATTTNMASSWSRTLASGRVGWFATGTGPNGYITPNVGGTNANIIRGSQFWYNASAMYLQMNPSGGNYTFAIGNNGTDAYGNVIQSPVFSYNRKYIELYKI